MAKVNELLSSRFKKGTDQKAKMQSLAKLSSDGALSSFSGVFRVTPLTDSEESALQQLLLQYSKKTQDISKDLSFLATLTSEVKAINNQAAMLHGERIKRAQEVLKNYKDGAFSSWLVQTYGNRQTPYNFLKYFELYSTLKRPLQEKVEAMPRQAIYTLATRNCPKEEKEEVIKEYKGETKKELLTLIRNRFPLSSKDKRLPNLAGMLLEDLKKIQLQFASDRFRPSDKQKKEIAEVLKSLSKSL